MRVAPSLAVVVVVASANGACRSRSPTVEARQQTDVRGARGSGSSAAPAAMQWQLADVLVEAAPPQGWTVSFVRRGSAPVVAFADATAVDPDLTTAANRWRSTIELRPRCPGPCDAEEQAPRVELSAAEVRGELNKRWRAQHEELAPGVWVSRTGDGDRMRLMVSHVVSGSATVLECQADIVPSASAQTAAIERFCTTLSYRVEASGLPFEHALGERYVLSDLEVVIPKPLAWSFYEYQRWGALTFHREAKPIGYTANLRFQPQRIGPRGLEGDIDAAAASEARRTSQIEWIERPTQRRAGIWSYSLRQLADRTSLETVVVEVAGARGDEALWCRVELRRPEDRAMAAAMQEMCVDRVAATAP